MINATKETTKTTVELAATDLARFDELMSASHKKVYNMAYRLSGSRPDAEDLTQDAYVRAYRSFKDFEGGRPFENWIFRIVTRLYLDLLRSRRRRVQSVSYDNPIQGGFGDDDIKFEIPDKSPDPMGVLLEQTFSEDLEKVLSTLNEDQRLLVQLADIEEVPYQEIAQIMGKPVGTIRSRLHRTHKLIRDRIEQGRVSASKARIVKSKIDKSALN